MKMVFSFVPVLRKAKLRFFIVCVILFFLCVFSGGSCGRADDGDDHNNTHHNFQNWGVDPLGLKDGVSVVDTKHLKLDSHVLVHVQRSLNG